MQKNKKLIIIAIILIVVILSLSLIGFLIKKGQMQNSVSVNLTVNNLMTEESFYYKGKQITTLELLKRYKNITTTSSTYGDFVNCIGQTCSNSSYYWMYYVNEGLAPVGAGTYLIQDKDNIKFSFESVSFK